MASVDNIINDFQIINQKILELYKSKMEPNDKWIKIATTIHEKNDFFIKLFNILSKTESRKEIKLNYETKFGQLEKQISDESDFVVKSSLIINLLHHIIYDLLSTEGNYYFSLNSDDEMQLSKKRITYYINVNTKPEQNICFHAFILMYALESLFNKRLYVGIDFEFTNKKIQLSQLNFEHSTEPKGIIMIVGPNELGSTIIDDFVEMVFCNKYIKKILHGSDSLDIPYVYEHLLKLDPEKIIVFTRTLIDTRFLCEYYKLSRDEPSDNKCSIYDDDPKGSAIYYFGLISLEQQNKLAEVLHSLPPMHDIQWNIFKMSRSQIYYAQYDVLFLKYFYYIIINKATHDEKSEMGKKTVIELYKHVLNELTRFVYLERREITFLMKKCKEEVDPINNYFVRKPNEILKMIDISNQVSTNINTINPKVNLDNIVKVNYFKGLIAILVRRLVYGILSRKCKIYKNKTTLWTDKLDNQFIFEFLKEIKFYYLEKLFKEVESIVYDRIISICSG
ncbi:MAG: hypothetical protein Satyrvirus17_4 [Satyrvirus sp.]|uniref:Uncharacterized protein n=1 Tax=Satyrvirus sp. TaxID=2487771 RepID=A0A3G5AFS4_9VIRU|nr:MAG: hypothetical protein Satyrvirus17_4 [Satyrvirus sp.]